MTKMIGRIFGVAAMIGPNIAFARSPAPPVRAAVANCVNAVRDTKPSDFYMLDYYQNFDAYYDPRRRIVVNNARVPNDQKPLYYFNKCMSQHGYGPAAPRRRPAPRRPRPTP